jgi:hypothetical protein
MNGTLTTLAVGAVAAALLTVPPSSYAGTSALAAGPGVEAGERQASVSAPRVRIGQQIKESPSNHYRFQGRKGQRVILMPDGWPQEVRGCVDNATLSRGTKKLTMGAVGDWRLPRTGTYRLRVGNSCVTELPLRLRRYQQQTHKVGDRLPTRFTRTLMRSALVRLPANRPVVLEQAGSGDWAYVTNAKPNGYPFTGCGVHVLTAGARSQCSAGDKVSRRVIVSAPEPSTVRLASVVHAQVDGQPVTVADPATTLVQVEVPGRTALGVEGAAVPHADLGARPWAALYSPSGDGDGWDITDYQVENPDGTRLPSGWRISKGGSYVFQLNRRLVGEGPQAFAVRTIPNPPPGETRW